MPAWLRRTLGVAGLLLLLAYAYAPLGAVGFVGDDFRILVQAGEVQPVLAGEVLAKESELPPLFEWRAADLYAVEGPRGGLLSGLSLALSRRLWGVRGDGGVHPSLAFRLENLALLVLAALSMRVFVHRLFQPWFGFDQARAAARTAAVLLLVHPLAPAAVARLSGRGGLLSLALATAAAAAFLVGRQDRKPLFALVAWVATLGALFAGELALGLPLALGLSEFLSSHRYRPKRKRLNTALTTLAVYGAPIFIAGLVRRVATNGAPVPGLWDTADGLRDWAGLAEVLALVMEKLGVLILPANLHSVGIAGTALAGAFFLIALQPALSAARSAPRLWGWLFGGWFAAVLLAELSGARLRIHPGDLEHAGELIFAVGAMCLGLGAAATAVSGPARWLLPAFLALGFASLARANHMPLIEAARHASLLASDLVRARELHGKEAFVVVLDLEHEVQGIDAVGDSPAWLLHPAITGEPEEAASLRVKDLSLEAFLMLAREREIERLRREPLLVVFDPAKLDAGGGAGGSAVARGTRESLVIPPAEPSRGARSWRGDARSPKLDLEAFASAALRVSSDVADTGAAPIVSWQGASPLFPEGSWEGIWVDRGAASLAFFDVSEAPAWLFTGRIRRVWFSAELPIADPAEWIHPFPSLGDLVPEANDEDWSFAAPQVPLLAEMNAEEAQARVAWAVALLDLETWEHQELPARLNQKTGRVVVKDIAPRVAEWLLESGGPVAWALECRVDGVAIARSGGRRVREE